MKKARFTEEQMVAILREADLMDHGWSRLSTLADLVVASGKDSRAIGLDHSLFDKGINRHAFIGTMDHDDGL